MIFRLHQQANGNHSDLHLQADLELEEPAHASYDSWSARNYRTLRNLWEQQTTMPEGRERWQEHQYHQPRYSYDPYGPSSSAGHSQGRASNTGFHYTRQHHDEELTFCQCTHNTLSTIQEQRQI